MWPLKTLKVGVLDFFVGTLGQDSSPNANRNPYFVYESLICQRQAICVTEIKDGGDKARVSGERNLLQQTQ